MLCVVRTTTTLARLLDVLSLIEPDLRVQVVFTYDPVDRGTLGARVARHLELLDAAVVPWDQAVRTRFDLVIAASENDRLYEFDGPVLLVPHGLGFQKYYPDLRTVAGLSADRLVHQGRVVPTVIALSHPEQRELLGESCPEAVPHARLVGDPTVDRLLASTHRAELYRTALDADGRRLVLLCSTWGRHSLFGSWPQLAVDLLRAMPVDEYRVVLSLHPGVFAAHGQRQVLAWLTRARRCGLAVLPMDDGWRAAVVAADVVIGDEGSPMLTAAAATRPVLFAVAGSPTTVAGSPLAELSACSPRLDSRLSLRAQVDGAIADGPTRQQAAVADRAVAARGESALLLRGVLYELLRLPEPADAAAFAPLDLPTPQLTPIAVHLVGATVSGEGVAVVRYTALGEPEVLEHRHVTADAALATLTELGSATVVYQRLRPADDFDSWSARTLAQWPSAQVVGGLRDGSCLARVRDGGTFQLTAPGVDPALLASLAYVRSDAPHTTLRLAPRTFDVVSAPVDAADR